MKILSRNDQSGRSMVEMLGVLAIIGVLSVGGISGYSKAMAKFKLTKAQDQISMLLMNIRTTFATSPSYAGLTSENAIAYNIAPSDMFVGNATSATELQNAFGGRTYVFSCDAAESTYACGTDASATKIESEQYFSITLDHLGREVCVSLATSDWGTDGLISVQVKGGTDDELATDELPFTLVQAGAACPSAGDFGSITWTYY